MSTLLTKKSENILGSKFAYSEKFANNFFETFLQPKSGTESFQKFPECATPSLLKLEQCDLLNPLTSQQSVNGLRAVGGCRQCQRTFQDQTQLIRHFCDHLPEIFYFFEKDPVKENQNCNELFENKSLSDFIKEIPSKFSKLNCFF